MLFTKKDTIPEIGYPVCLTNIELNWRFWKIMSK